MLKSKYTNFLQLAWLLPCCLIVYQLYLINNYSINLPYYDEWDYIGTDNLTTTPSISWLLAQHNEHRIVPTKLLMWALYKFNGMNNIFTLYLNFILYLGLISILSYYAYQLLESRSYLIPIVASIMLSPLNSENILWGFQSQFHFALIFQALAVLLASSKNFSISKSILVALLLIASMFSISFGTVMSIPSVLLINILWLSNLKFKKPYKLIPFNLFVFSAFYLWFRDYHKPGHHPDLAMPWTQAFWDYFLNILSFGFGYTSISTSIGALCLVVVILTIFISLFRKPTSLSFGWCILAISILAALAAISMGRAGLGINGSKSSRYVEIGMVLIFSINILALRLASKKLSVLCFSILLLSFIGYRDEWSTHQYNEKLLQEQESLTCLKNNLNSSNEFTCPTLYHGALREKLNFAQKNNFSLVQELK